LFRFTCYPMLDVLAAKHVNFSYKIKRFVHFHPFSSLSPSPYDDQNDTRDSSFLIYNVDTVVFSFSLVWLEITTHLCLLLFIMTAIANSRLSIGNAFCPTIPDLLAATVWWRFERTGGHKRVLLPPTLEKRGRTNPRGGCVMGPLVDTSSPDRGSHRIDSCRCLVKELVADCWGSRYRIKEFFLLHICHPSLSWWVIFQIVFTLFDSGSSDPGTWTQRQLLIDRYVTHCSTHLEPHH
jgi:hypothetical protein